MTLAQQLDAELTRLTGTHGTAVLNGDRNTTVTLDLTGVERLGLTLAELRVDVPHLAGADPDKLAAWGAELCARVTYLLEGIGPLECDPQNGTVLIRSVPPTRDAAATTFYEVMLSAGGGGHFTLGRYRSEKGVAGRHPEEMTLTRETLHRLVRDVAETIPA